jgi:hypothetical protein
MRFHVNLFEKNCGKEGRELAYLLSDGLEV